MSQVAVSDSEQNTTVNLIKVVGHANVRLANHDREIQMMKSSIMFLMEEFRKLERQKEDAL